MTGLDYESKSIEVRGSVGIARPMVRTSRLFGGGFGNVRHDVKSVGSRIVFEGVFFLGCYGSWFRLAGNYRRDRPHSPGARPGMWLSLMQL